MATILKAIFVFIEIEEKPNMKNSHIGHYRQIYKRILYANYIPKNVWWPTHRDSELQVAQDKNVTKNLIGKILVTTTGNIIKTNYVLKSYG